MRLGRGGSDRSARAAGGGLSRGGARGDRGLRAAGGRRRRHRRGARRRLVGGGGGRGVRGRVSDARAGRRKGLDVGAVAVVRGDGGVVGGGAADPANAESGSLAGITLVNQVAVAAVLLAVGVGPGMSAGGQGGRDDKGGLHRDGTQTM